MKIFILSLVNLFIFSLESWAFNPFGHKKIVPNIAPKIQTPSKNISPTKLTKKINVQEVYPQTIEPAKSMKPPLTLKAIIGNLVMINNQILTYGEYIYDYNISQISNNEVILKNENSHLILTVHE